MKIDPPSNKNEIQSFIGRINFLRRFIPNLAKILREITNMLKKDTEIKWNSKAKKSFSEVRLCVDFKNLNKVSLKESYPVPKMDHIL